MGLVTQHQLSTFSSPVNGTTPIDANTVRGNDNTIKISYNAHDADSTIHLQSGAASARPAQGTAGQTWLATDVGGVFLSLDNGSAWVDINYIRTTATSLPANVLASSLTSVGVLAAPHMTSPVIDSGGLTISSGTLTAGPLTVGAVTTSSDVQQSSAAFVYSYAGGTVGTVRAGIFNDGTNQVFKVYTAGVVAVTVSAAQAVTIASGLTVSAGGITGTGASSVTNSANATTALDVINSHNVNGDFALSTHVGSNCDNTTSWHLACGVTGVANRMYIYGNGNLQNTNNSYGAISDIKLKQDIVLAGSQWDDVKALAAAVKKFRFKDRPDGALQLGWVAQDVREISPGLVYETPDYTEVADVREVPDGEDENGQPKTKLEAFTRLDPLGTVTLGIQHSVAYMKAFKALGEVMARIEVLETALATR